MADLLRGLAQRTADKGYDDVARLRGAMSQRQVNDPAAFERANYIKVLRSYRATKVRRCPTASARPHDSRQRPVQLTHIKGLIALAG